MVTDEDRKAAADIGKKLGILTTLERIAVRERRFDKHPLVQSYAAHRIAALEEAAGACEQKQRDFLSPQYATGQPLSSFQERFACGQCATAIRALKEKNDG